ncbi:hypothetical protein BJP40_02380 [Streptomyces sp. CC53]|nr:hypothetical protein BJP40_02380 [Streptomyces sp. CC53]
MPAPRPEAEEDVAEQHTEEVCEKRHVVAYTYLRWLAPTTIDQLRCVALAQSTGERCKNLVMTSHLFQGVWEQEDIPIPPGRAGRETLWAGQKMWVYSLNSLDVVEYQRWKDQRCTHHGPGSDASDAATPQWVRFDTWRHAEFITYDEPHMPQAVQRAAHPLLSALGPPPQQTKCAGSDCTNGSAVKEPPGWVCWKCEKRTRERDKTHRKWQKPGDVDPPF